MHDLKKLILTTSSPNKGPDYKLFRRLILRQIILNEYEQKIYRNSLPLIYRCRDPYRKVKAEKAILQLNLLMSHACRMSRQLPQEVPQQHAKPLRRQSENPEWSPVGGSWLWHRQASAEAAAATATTDSGQNIRDGCLFVCLCSSVSLCVICLEGPLCFDLCWWLRLSDLKWQRFRGIEAILRKYVNQCLTVRLAVS